MAVLERIANALRLSKSDTEYLFTLARARVNAHAMRLTMPMYPGFVMVVLVPADAATAAIFSEHAGHALTLT